MSRTNDEHGSTGTTGSSPGGAPVEVDPAEIGAEVGPDDQPAPTSHRSRWPVVVAVLALVLAAVGAVRVVQLTGERDDLETQNSDLVESLRIARGDAGEQIEALETEIVDLTEDLGAADAELEATTSELERVRTERNQVTTQLADRTDELEAATERLDELDAQLEDLGRIEPMPELVGTDLADAEAFADDLGAILLVEEVSPGNVIARPGAVIEQHPAADVPLVAGSVIWVQVFTLDEQPDAED